MKSLSSLVLLSSLLLTTTHAQIPSRATSTTAEPVVAGPTTVTVPTTASELASGYATAISQMSLKSLVIFMRSDDKVVPIRGVLSARPMGAVLLILFSAGDTMAINAEHIVMITDGARTP